MCEDLRRSKRQRKETSYGDVFYTYLVGNEPLSFSEAISAPGIGPLRLKLIPLRKITLGL